MIFSVFTIAGDGRARLLAEELTAKLKKGGAEVCLLPEGSTLPSRQSDAAIAFGGDGFILAVAGQLTARGQTPLLGINCGHLGYLASGREVTNETVKRLLEGDYSVDRRMMLSADFGNGKKAYAINDLTLLRAAQPGENLGITTIKARCDGASLGSYRADGLIVSTPTGSTAYALSAGGSVIDPEMRCICLTPVCAHSLTARQIVLAPDKTVTLTCSDPKGRSLLCAVDGAYCKDLAPGERVTVRASKKTARFICFKDRFFFDTLRKKLTDESNA
ncbi:MAG: NAD(+)/NADH kinase [Clostridia bacterium]|nr:NAD(+)/NADH kinase [Clostridia bacterium]